MNMGAAMRLGGAVRISARKSRRLRIRDQAVGSAEAAGRSKIQAITYFGYHRDRHGEPGIVVVHHHDIGAFARLGR